MKIDYDLLRSLLLEIEDITDGLETFMPEIFYPKFPNINKMVIRYHIKYLFDIQFIEITNLDNYEYIDRIQILDITPKGRQYLCNVRKDNIWIETKKKLQPFGNVTLSIVSNVASSVILSRLGL